MYWIKIPSKEYEEYPAATFASGVICEVGYYVLLFSLLFMLLGFLCGDVSALFFLFLMILDLYVLSKHDAIIDFIIKRSIPESQRWKKVSEEELKIAKANQRKAKYLLSCGTRSWEFLDEAERADMTAREYKKYCKEAIAMYDELYRTYNRTHYPPAEY